MTKNPLARLGLSTKKARYRVNLIETYRVLTGKKRLVGQYITMAGDLTAGGRLQPMCEPVQLVESAFLAANQYVGIEVDPERHANNLRASGELPGITLLCGDFSGTCAALANWGRFNPGFLVLDTNWQPPRVIEELTYLWPLLRPLKRTKRILALNMVMNAKGRTYHHQDVLTGLNKSGAFLEMLNAGWRMSSKPYRYSGTDGSQKSMRMSTYFLSNV